MYTKLKTSFENFLNPEQPSKAFRRHICFCFLIALLLTFSTLILSTNYKITNNLNNPTEKAQTNDAIKQPNKNRTCNFSEPTGCMDFLFSNLDYDNLLSLITVIFTLPVTFAAAFVVIRISENTLALETRRDLRVTLETKLKKYDEIYSQLNIMASSLYFILEIAKITAISEREKLSAGSFDPESIHSIGGWDRSGENFLKNIINDRKNLLEAIKKLEFILRFMEDSTSYHQKGDHTISAIKSKINSFNQDIIKINDYPSKDKSDENIKKAVIKICSTNIRKMSDFLWMFEHYNYSKNEFCKYLSIARKLSESSFKYDFPTAFLTELLNNAVKSDLSNKNAILSRLLGFGFLPLTLLASTDDGNGLTEEKKMEISDHIKEEQIQIGLLALRDILETWPSQDDIIKHLLSDIELGNERDHLFKSMQKQTINPITLISNIRVVMN